MNKIKEFFKMTVFRAIISGMGAEKLEVFHAGDVLAGTPFRRLRCLQNFCL